MAPTQGKYTRYLILAILGLALFFLSRRSLPLPGTKHGSGGIHQPSEHSQSSDESESLGGYTLNRHSSSEVLRFAATHPGGRANATFVTLARNSDVWEISQAIRQVEDRFNNKFHYDWVFLNDQPFDDNFIRITTSLISGTPRYGQIPPEQWSYPDWIDQDKAREVREDMRDKKIIYGHLESYRHMCRYESGFFFRHPLLQEYEFYWRVEPGIELFCDIPYDPFVFMKENDKKYSFVMSLFEYPGTVPTLWDTVKEFINEHPEHVAEGNSMQFLSDDNGKNYNMCHFWSNFEIGSLDWLRSKEYVDYFETLDRKGGFYYERWGDAPIHSIAAGLFLKKEQLQFWDEIAYFHMPYTHCPHDEQLRMDLRCSCDPGGNFDWRDGSCLPRYYLANGIPLPDGVNTYGWLSTLGMIILLAGFIGLLIIAINPRARNHALLGGQHLYRQSQTFWERYQKERLEWEIERLARTRSNS
ncbi:glycosyltransferase family 15 protein [Aspergillus puulaauensis]|uniref:Alpha 1,2-mannosyltransferase 2.4.1 n=1 Tax=Aspergillus puulaauensis TaxID=1220207 RepID=A0A7R8AU32_9EURO|nr:alpha 1,2-mannosyltransferase 2.4.1 [Aspergillus puulaauensis]BCS29455.1 alpha 1,2-mannosyltransferase 2.4.1 [Aspergillus puulaauensis]